MTVLIDGKLEDPLIKDKKVSLLGWVICGQRISMGMTDEVVMLKGKRLLVTVPGVRAFTVGLGSLVKGAQDWDDFGEGQSSVLQGRCQLMFAPEVRPVMDENLFEVEFRNDLMDSPLADDWKVVMVVVTVTVDDRTNDWVRVRVKLMRAMAMVVIDWQVGNGGKRMTQQWDCPETDYADADAEEWIKDEWIKDEWIKDKE
ncbi:hypothetical protein PPACK8108_LOCUS20816 [Phakopsora pachyrhizi]|uniref:Uncharacterized protein n=1 Tax=Phakopsora pachyrhizi TaxID=170000 RepID=A0AAV0BGA2_PHAPC|nr:hypothetical protein PPACK8108_LOCUS20816 [Phakopsora pachyrhizi]